MNGHDSICDFSTVVVGPSLENLSHSVDDNIEKDAPPPSNYLAVESIIEKNFVEAPVETMHVVVGTAKNSSKKSKVVYKDEVVLASLVPKKNKVAEKGKKKNVKKVVKKNSVKKTPAIESLVKDVEQDIVDILGDIEEEE